MYGDLADFLDPNDKRSGCYMLMRLMPAERWIRFEKMGTGEAWRGLREDNRVRKTIAYLSLARISRGSALGSI